MKKISVGLIAVVALVLLGACSSNKDAKVSDDKDGKLEIVTTFYPMYDFTKNIVGDEANVKLMIPAGSEPHDYEPSAKDMTEAHDADVFVYHNENMETWVPKAQESWKKGAPNVVEGTKDMILLPGGEEEGHDHDHGEEGHHHEFDPHTWVSPKMAAKEVSNIKDQLIKLYPKKAKVFEANAEKYLTKLKNLDADYTASLKDAKQKSFVTQHAAFGYLALDYGLTQVPIAGLTPEQEPTSSRLAELKEYVQKNGINYIYFEKNANDKIAKTLANEANVKMEVLNPLESLTKKQIADGEDYVSVMEDNLKALEKTTTVPGEEITPEKEVKDDKTVANGYFEDDDVKDRELSDYAGDWQSVYPLLKDGSLDAVFDYKAKINKDMTAAEYKDYYTTGYQTDVETINIEGNTMDFVVKGEHHKYTYKYVGYKILTYEKGNRGVRFNFETENAKAGRFKYVQFSDHGIAPSKAAHFHIFFGGESQEKLYSEMHNWPTFYPVSLSEHEIAQEMLAH
ncbi:MULTISPECIES: zinc ABC transporter substrate-binding protein AdcA [unclassified Enterococcus]|uniref:zinc ABC transporter substrate-binding protein AdcA n=1 Tax=unclassified Enterococcus TaxID=2608891 RepID=UPI000A3372C6|nr:MULTISPECIES: zinc ABC transporter substrate-binding protein AdcA [unclassified Enterococcus]OTO67591.1 ABC zinc transporter substrate-binding protein [Enterococcus sp. 12E11_DIV0728]OUZ15529.1 ABC zinc transporter substrate-binding protein [Enterococcus sp. 12F9_DIV0723]